MKYLNLLLVVLILFAPLEPLNDYPKWATVECRDLIMHIVEHESGLVPEAQQFVFNQVVYDVKSMGCQNLIQNRWAIKSFPEPSKHVRQVVSNWELKYPKCQFIGNLNDIKIWNSFGYKTRVNYKFTHKGWTVVGVNCDVQEKD